MTPDAAVASLGVFVVMLIIGVALVLHFIPTIIALCRSHPHTLPIFIVNLFLGWSIIGWVVAFVWALITPKPVQIVVVRNQ